REALWMEPIYRNVFGLLTEFGDAEIASLIAPRPLLIEASRHPDVSAPEERAEDSYAAPGSIITPPLNQVESEVERVRSLTADLSPPPVLEVIGGGESDPGSGALLARFLELLGARLQPDGESPMATLDPPELPGRPMRQFQQACSYIHNLWLGSQGRREAFWSNADFTSAAALESTSGPYREILNTEVLGALEPASVPMQPRTRLIYSEPQYTGYEVMLNVFAEVFACGILLIPNDIAPGERRPVVVCQHGLEGRPQDTCEEGEQFVYYSAYARELTKQGYVTYSPQNPYIGAVRFRQVQRKAQPLHLTLMSFIVRQHERTLEWLAEQPFVDAARIGFYGISYGGKTAMRVPAVLPGYCLSICSADYNEWVWKNVTMISPYSYLLTNQYDMPEFRLGETFNYAELSWLIFPRPFMVERGHEDGVAPDEWVAYEFARTQRVYDMLGMGDRVEIEYFNGGHEIHSTGTFEFLRRHLGPIKQCP
ncbi:MAG TPA: hypothetical protein VGS41_06020, partial [Chthonomonadales bacterium]|nr:hypothetical protein [Chthonomonadales bacterium]